MGLDNYLYNKNRCYGAFTITDMCMHYPTVINRKLLTYLLWCITPKQYLVVLPPHHRLEVWWCWQRWRHDCCCHWAVSE